MIKSKIKKILVILTLLLLNGLTLVNSVNASNQSIYIHATGDCGELLTYKGIVVKANYVVYTKDGASYPAYCMDKTKVGADNQGYNVSVKDSIKDVALWRIIINGYPYKSAKELGTANKEEAFVATKQAIYCYIHGNNISDYAPIGIAGQRTLNAMKKILADAKNSKETKISSTIKINKNYEKWKQDKINKNYLSKTYVVSAGANIKKYKVTLSKENGKDLGGLRITNEKNEEKAEFEPNEKFKIMIPIKSITEAEKFDVKVETQIATKPILYGTAPNAGLQDYALTAAAYEDGLGNIQDEYPKNETEIIIIKVDSETKQRMKDVEFELIDSNKNVVYSDLKTNENGKIQINKLVPGIYYLRETNAKDGYLKYDELIKIEVKLNEKVTVTVNNKKEDKPTVETSKKEIEVDQDIVKEIEVKQDIINNEKQNKTKIIKQTQNQTQVMKENIRQVKTLPVTGM